MVESTPPPSGKRTRRLLLGAAALTLIVFVVLLLYLRSQDRSALLVPRDLAKLFNLDRDGILTYCRTKIRPAEYEGVLRGAHGALWAGEANAWDRVLLAVAALEAIGVKALVVPGDPPRITFRGRGWITMQLDADGPPLTSDTPPAEAIAVDKLPTAHPGIFHQIFPTLILEQDDGTVQRKETAKPAHVAEWIYQPVVLTATSIQDSVQYVLRVSDREILASGPLTRIRRASLELSWRFGDQTSVWRRELFDKVNKVNATPAIPGHDMPRVGDRYAVLLAGGPLGSAPEGVSAAKGTNTNADCSGKLTDVLRTRQCMLKQTALKDLLVHDLITLGTSYFVTADWDSRKLAKKTGVQATWKSPRIVIAAAEISPEDRRGQTSDKRDQNTPLAFSLDVLTDVVEASGDQAQAFHTALGLAKDWIETQIIFEATRVFSRSTKKDNNEKGKPPRRGQKTQAVAQWVPVVSASSVFARYTAALPATPERRIATIAAEAKRLLAEEPVGTQVELRIEQQPPLPVPPGFLLKIERTAEGLVLHGVREDATKPCRAQLEVAYEPDVWDRYVLDSNSSLKLAQDATGLALVAEAVASRCAMASLHLDYLLNFKVVRSLPLEPLPVTAGSVLVYRVDRAGIAFRFAVLVSLTQGIPSGTWVDLDSGRRGQVGGTWPEVVGRAPAGPTIAAFLAPSDVKSTGNQVRVKVRIGENDREIEAQQLSLPNGASAIILPAEHYPLILAWQQRDTSLVLESVSPVVRGRVLDDDTKLPVAGATLIQLDRHEQKGQAAKKAAADGSFVIPVTPPLFRRLLIVADRSGSMAFGLDPGWKQQDGEAPAGQQRMDALRNAVHALLKLLKEIAPGVPVALWSFSTRSGDHCSPEHTRVDHDFTPRLDGIRGVVDDKNRLKPEGGTPLTGAVIKVLDHMGKGPFVQDAVVVLLTDGINSCKAKTMATAFKERKGEVIIHTVGFAIEQGGEAEQELRALAEVSGGTYRVAGTGEELALVLAALGKTVATVELQAEAKDQGYEPVKVTIPTAQLASHDILIEQRNRLLTVRRANLGDLEKCKGLSPKARQMIEDRVRDDAWSVTIPKARVGIGSVTAYGWFETEIATGRMVGRTEDGLHGSIADPQCWPPFTIKEPLPDVGSSPLQMVGQLPVTQHPFVAWFGGITAYTTGSVTAALRFHQDTGVSATSEDFGRFVQANALEFAAGWWKDVGSQAYGAMGSHYWSGVCLTFEMQCAAMQSQDCDTCFRHWAQYECGRIRDMIKRDIEESLKEALAKESKEALTKDLRATQKAEEEAFRRKMRERYRDLIKTRFGEPMVDAATERGFPLREAEREAQRQKYAREWIELVDKLRKRFVPKGVDPWENAWELLFNEGILCKALISSSSESRE